MGRKTVKTMFSVRYKDPKEVHHPEPDCPERKRIEREGNDMCREVEGPECSLLAFGANRRGNKIARLLEECRTCRSLRTVYRRMNTPAHPRSDSARTGNRRGNEKAR